MTYQQKQFEKFISLVEQHVPEEGLNYTLVENFGTFKASNNQTRTPMLDQPAIWIVAATSS